MEGSISPRHHILITPSILHAAQGEIPVPENRFLRNILILTGVALLFFQ